MTDGQADGERGRQDGEHKAPSAEATTAADSENRAAGDEGNEGRRRQRNRRGRRRKNAAVAADVPPSVASPAPAAEVKPPAAASRRRKKRKAVAQPPEEATPSPKRFARAEDRSGGAPALPQAAGPRSQRRARPDTAPPAERPAARRPPAADTGDRRRARREASFTIGRAFWLAVGVLTVLALIVRLPGLGRGLWADEIWAIMESFRTPFPETLSVFPGDNKHPLYALIAHASRALFGESAWSVRLPALLFGVATVPVLYALGARLSSRIEAFAAAALLAFSYHHVWFSQNARGYSALAFFATLGTWLLLRAMDSEGWKEWVWYGLVAGLGVYTHLTFVFTVVAQAIIVGAAVLGWPRSDKQLPWRGPLLGFSLAAVVGLLLYLPMLPLVLNFFLHKQSNLKGISSPTWALGEAFRVLRVGFGGALGIGLTVLTIGAAVGLAGVVSFARQSTRTAMLLIGPALFTLLGAFAARGTMYPRFFFLLVGFALLIGIRGAFATGSWLARLRGGAHGEIAGQRLGTLLAGALVVASALSVPINWRVPKQDFEGAAEYVEGAANAGDAIVMTDVTSSIYGAFYQKPWPSIRTASELDAMRHAVDPATGRTGRIFLLYTFPRYLVRFDSTLAAYVERECTASRVRRFRGTIGDGDILVCQIERS